MEFPHIKDTKFPWIENVNVYKYQNNFDYARWNGKVSFKLLNVLWNSNYADVPYFDTEEKRDEWFDAQDGYVGTLESLFNNTPENSVKVPIPYNDAYRYNYLVVDMPVQTSVDNPINYEDSSIRVKRWFYFIEDITQAAPSTTELILSVDYWTTFIHDVQIPYLMLERGHAPMVQTSVETYLANPIMNNEYLLADDFNYGNDTVIQTSVYKPIGNGKKYVLFCAPYRYQDFDLFNSSAWSGESTPPSYADQSNRWGYQLTVNDYAWKYGDADYSNSDLPINNMIQTGILNGCECFAIEGSEARSFFNDCAEHCVHFLHGIKAMFILDESLFTKSQEFTFRGKTLYVADRKINTNNFTFTKAAFGFDSKYANITKLYTSPYSTLEITDDEGGVFSAKIENCGNVQMHEEVALVYPFLNYNVFFSGINGAGSMNYVWKSVQDSDNDKTMWASDFSKFMMNWEIPTYEIYVSAENEYAANHAADMIARRAGAIKDYQNAVRYANTSRENVADSMATNTSNIAATGATNTGNVQRSTAKDVVNTAATNAGLVANMEATNDTQDTIVDTLQHGGSFTTGGGGGFVPNSAWINFEKVADDADTDWIVIQQGFDVTREYAVGMATQNIGATVAGGNFIGAINTGVSTALTITNDSNLKTIQQQAITAKTSHARTAQQKMTAAMKTFDVGVKDEQNDLREANTNRFSATNGINNANEGRNKTANDANAADTQATNNANAVRTQNTETANAGYNRNATVAAEKANLVQKQLEAENAYKNARLQTPHEQGNYSGDFAPDVYQRRGVRINIRTQAKSAIAQAGDAMLRFGYALHRVWDMSNGFHYGKEFTFWKAEDIWINDGSGTANAATDAIGNILMKGVTVWKNPEKIGTIGIYNNL